MKQLFISMLAFILITAFFDQITIHAMSRSYDQREKLLKDYNAFVQEFEHYKDLLYQVPDPDPASKAYRRYIQDNIKRGVDNLFNNILNAKKKAESLDYEHIESMFERLLEEFRVYFGPIVFRKFND